MHGRTDFTPVVLNIAVIDYVKADAVRDQPVGLVLYIRLVLHEGDNSIVVEYLEQKRPSIELLGAAIRLPRDRGKETENVVTVSLTDRYGRSLVIA